MLLCSSGFYLGFNLKLYSIKQTQKQIILSSRLRDQFVHNFAFSKNDIQKSTINILFKEKNEIKYKGKMYDIISQKDDRDSLFIQCISDEEEDYTLALSGNEKIKLQKQKDTKDLSDIKFNLNNFILYYEIAHIKSADILLESSYFFALEKTRISYLNVPSPPPWC